MLDIFYWSFLILIVYFLSDYISYYVALLLFIIVMPIRNKWGHILIVKVLIFTPFILGYALDIFWSVLHFTRKLYLMNKKSNVKYSWWPKFRNLALTPRLQDILDVYPKTSKAYAFAFRMSVLLNKFDPEHLKAWRGIPQ